MYSYRYSKTIFNNETIDTTTEGTAYTYTTSFQANRIKFWILLSLQFLSFPCFIYLFFHFISKKQLYRNIHNHVVILLLIISFLFLTIALSLTLAYMYTSQVYPASDMFCTLWNWFHYSVNIINLFLMAFASIERNWLIFHPKLVKSKGGRFLFHYCPLVFCVIYPPMFYASAMFIYQCVSDYDYTQLLCKWPCYFYNDNWTNVDLFFNNYTPLFSIPLFCSIIYIRVIIKRRYMKQQRFKWRRDKKLVLQILVLSSLYLAMWMPIQISGLINLYWLPTFLLQAQIDYMYLFPYLIHIIYPYIVLFTLHGEKFKLTHHQSVHPQRN
jgi:hypothetical protein